MPSVHARKDKMISGLTGGIEMLFKKNKIDWLKGTARLAGGLKVEVTLHEGGTQTITAKKEIIVATGSSPRSVPGIEVDRKMLADIAVKDAAAFKALVTQAQAAIA